MIDLYTYKTYLGITNTKNDSKIGRAVEAANRIIENYIKQKFTADTQTSTLNPNDLVFLPYSNVSSVVSILSDGEAITEFFLDDYGVIEILEPLKSTAKRSLVVEYTLTDMVPEDLIVAAIELTTHYVEREFNMSMTKSGETVDYKGKMILPDQVKLVLDLHKCL